MGNKIEAHRIVKGLFYDKISMWFVVEKWNLYHLICMIFYIGYYTIHTSYQLLCWPGSDPHILLHIMSWLILSKKQLFDLEVKGQGPTKVIMVRYSLPYGHAPTYQI
jgi:hypothetical protein